AAPDRRGHLRPGRGRAAGGDARAGPGPGGPVKLSTRGELRTRVVGLTGPKGSPGCTFLAVGLARCLADHGLPTLLIDADPDGPAVSAMLDLPRRGAAQLARAAVLGLDPQVVRDAGQEVSAQLWCLEPAVVQDGLDGRELVQA